MIWYAQLHTLSAVVKFDKYIMPWKFMGNAFCNYRETSNINHTLIGNKIVNNSDVVGASPVDAAPSTSSFST